MDPAIPPDGSANGGREFVAGVEKGLDGRRLSRALRWGASSAVFRHLGAGEGWSSELIEACRAMDGASAATAAASAGGTEADRPSSPLAGAKVQKTTASSSYDTTMTTFEAELAAHMVPEPSVDWVADALSESAPRWSWLKQQLDASGKDDTSHEAASRLILNHAAVLRDVTNPTPKSQMDVPRVRRELAKYVYQALREIARRLLGLRSEQARLVPTDVDQLGAWAQTAKVSVSRVLHICITSAKAQTRRVISKDPESSACVIQFLDARIQSKPEERPGRAPDMSAGAAAEMRGVIQQLWWLTWSAAREMQSRAGRSRWLR